MGPLRFLCLLGLLTLSSLSRAGENIITCQVYWQDELVKDVQVWAMPERDYDKESPVFGPYVPDEQGQVQVKLPEEGKGRYFLVAQDKKGRYGFVSANSKAIRLSLIDVVPISAKLVFNGKPIAGVRTRVIEISRNTEKRPEIYEQISSREILEKLKGFETVSDASGKVQFPFIPEGMKAYMVVEKDGISFVSTNLKPDQDNIIPLTEAASLELKIEGINNYDFLNEVKWRLYTKKTETAEAQTLHHHQSYFLNRWKDNRLENINPGEYTLYFNSKPRLPFYLGNNLELRVEAGKTNTLVIKPVPWSIITGRLVDSETKKGIPGIHMIARSSDKEKSLWDLDENITDADGRYTLRVIKNVKYTVELSDIKNKILRFALEPIRHFYYPIFNDVQVATDDKLEMRDYVLEPNPRLKGNVLWSQTDGGQKVEAPFEVYNTNSFNYKIVRASQKNQFFEIRDGEFELLGFPKDTPLTFRVRKGKAVNIPERLLPEQIAKGVSITISEANGSSLFGKIVDQAGKAVAGATVKLNWHCEIDGEKLISSSFTYDEIVSDIEGRFQFDHLWPNENYHLTIEGDTIVQFEEGFNTKRKLIPGEKKDLGTFKVQRRNATLRGKVTGLDGQLLQGVTVGNYEEDLPSTENKTNIKGEFILNELRDEGFFVVAKKVGYRPTFVWVESGQQRVDIRLRQLSDPPEPIELISREHIAKEKEMITHFLTVMWERRELTKQGRSVFNWMASHDRKIAEMWAKAADEKEGKDVWKKELGNILTKDKMIELLVSDTDSAISKLKESGGFANLQLERFGRLMLEKDKKISLLLAEAAAQDARDLEKLDYWKCRGLAGAGELAILAGNTTGGRKLIDEAIEALLQMEKQKGEFSDQARGFVASCLVPWDTARAEKLLSEAKTPHLHNMGLTRAIENLAKTDPKTAKLWLSKIKGDDDLSRGRVLFPVAKAYAKESVDEAVEILAPLLQKKQSNYYAQGLVEIALVIHKENAKKAHELIDEAFKYMEINQSNNLEQTNGSLAAVLLHRAAEMNYPDMHALVARTLALRASTRLTQIEIVSRRTRIATSVALACTCPDIAKKIFIVGDGQKMNSSVENLRETWFLVCLSDPDTAKKYFDQRARKVNHESIFPGTTEYFNSVLNGKDRIANLSSHMLFHVIEMDEE